MSKPIVRTSIIISPEHDARLKELARRRGHSYSQVVRDALDLALPKMEQIDAIARQVAGAVA